MKFNNLNEHKVIPKFITKYLKYVYDGFVITINEKENYLFFEERTFY